MFTFLAIILGIALLCGCISAIFGFIGGLIVGGFKLAFHLARGLTLIGIAILIAIFLMTL